MSLNDDDVVDTELWDNDAAKEGEVNNVNDELDDDEEEKLIVETMKCRISNQKFLYVIFIEF